MTNPGWRKKIADESVSDIGARRICASCLYFQCGDNPNEEMDLVGTCGRYPPVLADDSQGLDSPEAWSFPSTRYWMSCGEWLQWVEEDETPKNGAYGGRRPIP